MDRDEVREALRRVLASEAFKRSKRSREMLAHVVEAALDGRAGDLKAYTIAVDVFGKGADFDLESDSIVRVQGVRVRELLDAYYCGEGADDAIRIELPKGTYAPTFIETAPPPDAAPTTALAATRPGGSVVLRRVVAGGVIAVFAATATWWWTARLPEPAPTPQAPQAAVIVDRLTVAVLPMTDAAGAPSEQGARLSQGVTDGLSRVASISLASSRLGMPANPSRGTDPRRFAEAGVRFVLEGRIFEAEGRATAHVDLTDTKTGKFIWTRSYEINPADGAEKVAAAAGRVVADLHLVLYKASAVAIEAGPIDAASPKELFLLSTWVPGRARNGLRWEQERVELARRAIEIDPDYGPAHSVLADKLAYLANVDPLSDTEEARNRAAHHARRAIETAPDDVDAVFNVAIHYWHAGRIADSIRFTRRTLEIAPHHPLATFLSKVVPYTCAVAPNEVLDDLVAWDAGLSAANPERWVVLTWIATLHLNRGDFAAAAEYGRRADAIFRTPDTFYRLAAALVRIGEIDAAREIFADQRQNWPNLDPRHYAEVAIPRRCGDAPRADFVRQVYAEMAKAVGGPSSGTANSGPAN